MASPNTDQLRERIDRGQTGDKVDFPDPAAAPLGTDDEAAGRPPEAARTLDAPARLDPALDAPAIEAGSRKPSLGGKVMLLVIAVAAVAAVAMIATAIV